jgi:cell division transport system permease protein
MRQWLNLHVQAMGQVIARLRRNMLATLLMWCVMGITLSLPGVLYIAIDNLNRITASVQSEPQISLFLDLKIAPDAIADMKKKLADHAGVKSYRFVGKDAAWDELKKNTGIGPVSDLDQNPLPDAFFIQPKGTEPEAIEALQHELQQWQGVELAQLDATWIKRLYAVLELGRQAVLILAILLSFALLAIIGNTIRLQVVTQREEIEVSRLIGATDNFIRRPFLYAGTFYGLGGGLAALLFLLGITLLFNASTAEIARLYNSDFTLDFLDFFSSLSLIVIAALLGWMGSYAAVNRSLAKFAFKT